MTKEAINVKALMAVLITVALISFTVQSILDPDSGENRIELTAPVTGNIVAEPDDNSEDLNQVLTEVGDWLLQG